MELRLSETLAALIRILAVIWSPLRFVGVSLHVGNDLHGSGLPMLYKALIKYQNVRNKRQEH